LQAGTYVQDNYAAEPALLKNIFEANAGFSISKKNRLWIDAGIFGSHIGFESAITSDNWTLTRSLLAENSPYYLAGAKMTYKPKEKWELAALVLNGWQRIQRVSGSSLPSFGTQLKYTKSDKWTLNWSTFIGTDDPDLIRRMRYFSNLFAQVQINKKFGLIAGFDLGAQQRSKNSSQYYGWLSPVLLAQIRLKEKWKTAFRVEYYRDSRGVIIPTNIPNGFETAGISWNLDYSPAQNFVWRFETRYLKSPDKLFPRGNVFVRDDVFFGTSVAVKF
jgi:Putative beta-barrel porin-2, OmpL-like. bbp2